MKAECLIGRVLFRFEEGKDVGGWTYWRGGDLEHGPNWCWRPVALLVNSVHIKFSNYMNRWLQSDMTTFDFQRWDFSKKRVSQKEDERGGEEGHIPLYFKGPLFLMDYYQFKNAWKQAKRIFELLMAPVSAPGIPCTLLATPGLHSSTFKALPGLETDQLENGIWPGKLATAAATDVLLECMQHLAICGSPIWKYANGQGPVWAAKCC